MIETLIHLNALSLFDLPWWDYVLVVLAFTHLTIVGTTLYLHRAMAHRSVVLHPAVNHVFRFWLWISTGIVTKEWVAIHRKHHAKVETDKDPHSPVVKGFNRIMWLGAWEYHKEIKNTETIEKYGFGCPDDWLERNIYTRQTYMGPVSMLLINVVLFGLPGLAIWLTQMLWIPLWAAGVINGVGHYFGYRNFGTPDASRNIVPWAFFIGGEELHNNHHAFAGSAKFSNKPWEFDLGWTYLRVLEKLGLANVKKCQPRLAIAAAKPSCDIETVKAVLENRFQIMANYTKEVTRRVYKEETKAAKDEGTKVSVLKRAYGLMKKEHEKLNEYSQRKLAAMLKQNPKLDIVYTMRQRLHEIWAKTSVSNESLLSHLEEWCRAAEESGVDALKEFSAKLKRYELIPA